VGTKKVKTNDYNQETLIETPKEKKEESNGKKAEEVNSTNVQDKKSNAEHNSDKDGIVNEGQEENGNKLDDLGDDLGDDLADLEDLQDGDITFYDL